MVFLALIPLSKDLQQELVLFFSLIFVIFQCWSILTLQIRVIVHNKVRQHLLCFILLFLGYYFISPNPFYAHNSRILRTKSDKISRAKRVVIGDVDGGRRRIEGWEC